MEASNYKSRRPDPELPPNMKIRPPAVLDAKPKLLRALGAVPCVLKNFHVEFEISYAKRSFSIPGPKLLIRYCSTKQNGFFKDGIYRLIACLQRG